MERVLDKTKKNTFIQPNAFPHNKIDYRQSIDFSHLHFNYLSFEH